MCKREEDPSVYRRRHGLPSEPVAGKTEEQEMWELSASEGFTGEDIKLLKDHFPFLYKEASRELLLARLHLLKFQYLCEQGLKAWDLQEDSMLAAEFLSHWKREKGDETHPSCWGKRWPLNGPQREEGDEDLIT